MSGEIPFCESKNYSRNVEITDMFPYVKSHTFIQSTREFEFSAPEMRKFTGAIK